MSIYNDLNWILETSAKLRIEQPNHFYIKIEDYEFEHKCSWKGLAPNGILVFEDWEGKQIKITSNELRKDG